MNPVKERLDQIKAIVVFTVAFIFILGMASYDPNDIPFETSDINLRTANYAGVVGAYLAWFCFKIFGYASYALPILMMLWGIWLFKGKVIPNLFVKLTGSAVFLLTLSSLLSISFSEPTLKVEYGGIIGFILSGILLEYCGLIGSYIVIISCLLLSSILATEFLAFPYILGAIQYSKSLLNRLHTRERKVRLSRIEPKAEPDRIEPTIIMPSERPQIKILRPQVPGTTKAKPRISTIAGDYKLPSLDLLNSPSPVSQRKLMDDLGANSKILEDTLQDFGIEAKVREVERGPIVTVYEIQPAPGIKITRITALADDIALVMKAPSVRIVAPIPGKSVVGIEVPNSASTLVYLREVLESKEFKEMPSKLTLALGKDVSGNPLVGDLGEFPHLLIAGTTGSGKTVCVNSLVMSLLFNAAPDELKMLMVDPKMVELGIFNGIPHLLSPVVTEPKKAAAALRWIVQEMEGRYKLFAKMGARNIELYNEKSDERMPYIVVIIDELADLMLIASQDIEDSITRLAQLSRAVGIHIVLATQRPSVDVITGVIKANFPARISFQVASKVDSRTVLDMNGADKLIGKGDMLFLKPGEAKPIRAQGSLVTDDEIEKVIEFIKSQREPCYDDEILKGQEKTYVSVGWEKDELYEEAKQMVRQTGIASVSMLQRRLRLGYTRAARLIDMMEEEGIVGPYRGSKPRELLVEKTGNGINRQ